MTRPHHDRASIAQDALNLLAAAREDAHDKAFAARLGKHELDELEAKIHQLKLGEGANTTRLHAQVAAGAQTAAIRAPLFELLVDVRDDAILAFPGDEALQRAFGKGTVLNPASSSSLEAAGHAVLAAAEAHAKEAAQLHLDAKGVHHLEDLLHALEGADVAHVRAANDRHASTTATDSLAHLVSAEVAHLRRVARRVYRHDETKLGRYASSLPRHAVKPRSRHAAAPGPTTAG